MHHYADAMGNFAGLALKLNLVHGLVVGLTYDKNHFVQIFMAASGNGCEVEKDGTVMIADTDPYPVMCEVHNKEHAEFIVGNGPHTDDIHEALVYNDGFHKAVQEMEESADRALAAVCYRPGRTADIAIRIKSRRERRNETFIRTIDEFDPGIGHGVMNWRNDIAPAYRDVFLMPIDGVTPSHVLAQYWDWMNRETRQSIVVKFIPVSGNEPSLVQCKTAREMV